MTSQTGAVLWSASFLLNPISNIISVMRSEVQPPEPRDRLGESRRSGGGCNSLFPDLCSQTEQSGRKDLSKWPRIKESCWLGSTDSAWWRYQQNVGKWSENLPTTPCLITDSLIYWSSLNSSFFLGSILCQHIWKLKSVYHKEYLMLYFQGDPGPMVPKGNIYKRDRKKISWMNSQSNLTNYCLDWQI